MKMASESKHDKELGQRFQEQQQEGRAVVTVRFVPIPPARLFTAPAAPEAIQ